MNLAEVMDELATAIDTINGLRVFAYPTDTASPPAAMVWYPEAIEYDVALARGGDRLQVPIWVVVGGSDVRSARNELVAYASGSGDSSVKAAIEAHEATAYDSARVIRAEYTPGVLGGVSYIGMTFYVDVIGTGSE